MSDLKEIWKDIPGYEGLYQASTFGRIKALIKFNKKSRGRGLGFIPEKIMATPVSKSGYQTINLWKNRKRKQFSVHRLVAITFIPNPKLLPDINHKNVNKVNNWVENLEWCTKSQNSKHAHRNGRMPGAFKKDDHGRPVVNSSTGAVYPSIKAAGDTIGMCRHKLAHMLRGLTRNKTSFKYAS